MKDSITACLPASVAAPVAKALSEEIIKLLIPEVSEGPLTGSGGRVKSSVVVKARILDSNLSKAP